MNPIHFDIDRFTFSYGKKNATAFSLVSPGLHLTGHNIYWLHGPNGSGKTTFIKIITGTISNNGLCAINGISSRTIRQYQALIGYVPDREVYPPNYRCMDIIELSQVLYRLTAEQVTNTRSFFGEYLPLLDPLMNLKAQELSTGQQKLLSITARLLHRPPVVILDEPFAGLDDSHRDAVTRMILHWKDAGKCILFSSNMAENAELCDQEIQVKSGVVQGPCL